MNVKPDKERNILAEIQFRESFARASWFINERVYEFSPWMLHVVFDVVKRLWEIVF